MKAAEKSALYEILKKTSAALLGYESQAFMEEPRFFDDAEAAPSAPIVSSAPAEPESSGKTAPASIQQADAAAALVESGALVIEAGATIDSISKKIAACSRCPLSQKRKNVVPGEGVINPAVLVVGEGPGADEDEQGRPFVGRAGQLLDKMLAAINLSREKNCFIANIVKCRPPMNRDPEPQEAQACRSFLDAQIHVLKPKMILALGRVAMRNLLDTSIGINQMRGRFVDFKGIPFMATYHPSALLRDESLKRPAWEDLKAFRQKLLEICPDYDK